MKQKLTVAVMGHKVQDHPMIWTLRVYNIYIFRHVPKSKNLGGQVVMGGYNVPPLVEIGLTDPPKSGGAAAPPAPPFGTCLYNIR